MLPYSKRVIRRCQISGCHGGEGVRVPGTRKSRLRDTSRIDYARSAANINCRLRSKGVSSHTAIKTKTPFKEMRHKNGALERWKARLVAQGFL